MTRRSRGRIPVTLEGTPLAMGATGDARSPAGSGVRTPNVSRRRPEAVMTTMTSADQGIRDAVTRHLAWQPGLDASIVVVSTRGGVVTLSGYVETCAEKTVAERTAREVFGVRAVVNDLEVRVALHRIDPNVTRETVAGPEEPWRRPPAPQRRRGVLAGCAGCPQPDHLPVANKSSRPREMSRPPD